MKILLSATNTRCANRHSLCFTRRYCSRLGREPREREIERQSLGMEDHFCGRYLCLKSKIKYPNMIHASICYISSLTLLCTLYNSDSGDTQPQPLLLLNLSKQEYSCILRSNLHPNMTGRILTRMCTQRTHIQLMSCLGP